MVLGGPGNLRFRAGPIVVRLETRRKSGATDRGLSGRLTTWPGSDRSLAHRLALAAAGSSVNDGEKHQLISQATPRKS
jgi:hypothetical protein